MHGRPITQSLGGNTAVAWAQRYSLYQVNQISFDDFAKTYTAFYLKNGLTDFLEQQRDWRRGMQRNEQYLAGIRGRAILATDAAATAATPDAQAAAAREAESAWVRYRAITASRQIWDELNHARQLDLVKRDTLPENFVPPYEYSTNVLAKIRQRIRAEQTP